MPKNSPKPTTSVMITTQSPLPTNSAWAMAHVLGVAPSQIGIVGYLLIPPSVAAVSEKYIKHEFISAEEGVISISGLRVLGHGRTNRIFGKGQRDEELEWTVNPLVRRVREHFSDAFMIGFGGYLSGDDGWMVMLAFESADIELPAPKPRLLNRPVQDAA